MATKPANIKFGADNFEYASLNFYQQTIYDEILRQYEGIKGADDAAKAKLSGVIEYLVGKMKLYGGLTPISLYQDKKPNV